MGVFNGCRGRSSIGELRRMDELASCRVKNERYEDGPMLLPAAQAMEGVWVSR